MDSLELFKKGKARFVSTAITLLMAASSSLASPFELSYGGRLTEASGKPLKGPVDLTLRFFRNMTDGVHVGPELLYTSVQLNQGAFQVTIALDDTQSTAVFGDGNLPVFIEVEAAGRAYPRQQFLTVPYALYALRVPVDGDTIIVNSAGLLEATTGGSGDMKKERYDTNAATTDSVDRADSAADADRLDGQLPSYYLDASNITTNASERFVTDTQIANWTTAHGWGSHSTAGYLTSSSSLNVANLSGTIDDSRIPSGIARDTEVPSLARSGISGSGPVTYNTSTGVISINNATTSDAGAMSADDKVALNTVVSDVSTLSGSLSGKVAKIGDTMTGTLQVNGGQIVSNQGTVASGSTADFATGNVQVMQDVGGSTITLANMLDGGAYTVIVTDGTPRTYSFVNCDHTHDLPELSETAAASRSIFTILKTTENTETHCYISWVTGL